MKNLLIVESPAKAKTIGKYLGKDYEVAASFGHIRDLPSKNGSVDPDADFALHYEVSAKSAKYVKDIVDKAKRCQRLILALDPDREGEAIAWHIIEVLKQKKALKSATKIERVVFNAITKNSVLEAMNHPRAIDMDLVNAQQARRALDYLVGFTLSPVLWRKLPGSRSAGRVQSVALRIICDREDEIDAFKSQEYWDIKVVLESARAQSFSASLTHVNDQKLEKFSIPNEVEASQIAALLQNKAYLVTSVNRKESRRKPYPPFTTSTLQQTASHQLGFSAKKTMQIAQKLYEGVDIGGGNIQGLITYMRTDGVYVVSEAIEAARVMIKQDFGPQYLPPQPILYKNKVKNAQEAHEAIRPTDCTILPKKIAAHLEADHLALYNLIWKRMVASQMADMILDQVAVIIKTKPPYGELKVTGSVIKFAGFYVLYGQQEEEKNEEDEDENSEKTLPDLQVNEALKFLEVKPAQHFTEPPPRYGEASLVKKMEELGIGRPSTYATIISVLQDRGYVKLDKKRFIPEERGRIVTVFLKEFFAHYVEYDYTASLEDELDIISNGELNWKKFLKQFWLDFDRNIIDVSKKTIPEILESLNQKIAANIFGLDENGKIKNQCPSCSSGLLGIKIGKYGVFIGCSSYPECRYTKQIAHHRAGEDGEEDGQAQLIENFAPKLLGKDEMFGEIFLKKGPYGFYVEAAKNSTANKENIIKKKSSKKSSKKPTQPKPKRVSVPKNINIETIDLNLVKKLLSLPREVGIHPKTGLKIIANNGPYGPYLSHDQKYTSVKTDDILEIGLDRAIILIEENELRKLNKKNPRSFKKNLKNNSKNKNK